MPTKIFFLVLFENTHDAYKPHGRSSIYYMAWKLFLEVFAIYAYSVIDGVDCSIDSIDNWGFKMLMAVPKLRLSWVAWNIDIKHSNITTNSQDCTSNQRGTVAVPRTSHSVSTAIPKSFCPELELHFSLVTISHGWVYSWVQSCTLLFGCFLRLWKLNALVRVAFFHQCID